MHRLGIKPDYGERWDSLSHGERKRVQLATALWKNPPLLAVDEPTNHLDKEGRALMATGLEGYEGIGLLVSHDRVLLDRLCRNCLFIRGGRGVLRPGGITQGLQEEERERLELERQRNGIRTERERLAVEADRRRRDAESAKNRLSKKHVDPKDHSTKGKINLAKLSGKDTQGARLYKNIQRRVSRLDISLENFQTLGERKHGVSLDFTRAKMDRLYYSPAGIIPLGEGRSLKFPEITITPGDRIALTGLNGAGKSTLIGHILSGLPFQVKPLYIPQEITTEESVRLLQEVLGKDEKSRGEIISRFSRLGSDPASILQSRLPSPGEVRKLMIARGIFTNPPLIIMDEPTNHLDLLSMRLLEETLNEVEAALLLVSHDEVFLSKLTLTEWAISRDGTLLIK
jgi:ATPase subunit of ABC transporter with duplicated ATPase domains